jgi:hypothetical protein
MRSDHHLYIPYTSFVNKVFFFFRAALQMLILGDEQLEQNGKGLVLSKQATVD